MDYGETIRNIRHDAASCFKFVKATAASCNLRRRFPSYLKPTEDLLSHLYELSRATLDYLAAFPDRTPTDEEDFRRHRQELWTIRSSWKDLHLYVKPVVDADTLKVPTALVKLLTRRVQLIADCNSFQFAVIHTDKLNYLQFPAGEFEQKVRDLGEIVNLTKAFPPDLGIIALPHSQAKHLFLNGLLAHEIGHYVFSRLGCLGRLAEKLNAALGAAFPPPLDSGLDAQIRGRLPNIISDWAEELFCDLFGVHLLGPSFALASIELFDIANDWNPGGHIDSEAAARDFKFSASHPGRLFRLWRQAELLQSLGWWPHIRHRQSHYIRLLEKALDLRPASFSAEFVGVHSKNVIDAFCRVLPDVEDEAMKVTENLRDERGQVSEIQDFQDLHKLVLLYLSNAVVPSTLLREDSTFTEPDAVTLLNASHLFYIDEIQSLMEGIQEQNPAVIEKREYWMEKVESWATKALEDLIMLKGV